jgi:hypothetical protein
MKLWMKGMGVAAILGVLLLIPAGPVQAQVADTSDAVVCLHAQAHNTKGITCDDSPEVANIACDQYVKNWPLQQGADVFMIVAMADSMLGVSGVSIGILYSNPVTLADGIGVDVFDYTMCADLEYTNSADGNLDHEFPYSGGGNRLIWVRTTNCQQHVIGDYGVHATACVFYVYAYSDDQMQVTMNMNLDFGPEILIVDCPGPANHPLRWPQAGGKVGFGGEEGFNPCTDVVPVKNTTWGRLKTQYKD